MQNQKVISFILNLAKNDVLSARQKCAEFGLDLDVLTGMKASTPQATK